MKKLIKRVLLFSRFIFDELILKNHTRNPFYSLFKILKITSLEFLFSIIISWLELFYTRISVQFPRGTIERE